MPYSNNLPEILKEVEEESPATKSKKVSDRYDQVPAPAHIFPNDNTFNSNSTKSGMIIRQSPDLTSNKKSLRKMLPNLPPKS